MLFRRISLYGFWGPILSFFSLIDCGFYSPSHIVLLSPLSLPSLSGNWRLFLPWALPRFASTRVAWPVPLMLVIRVLTALDALPFPRYNFDHWDSRGSTLLPGWVSQKRPGKPQERKLQSKQNQLGIMPIHPSHAYQHGFSRGLQNDALPASAGSQVMMSLKSLWPVTPELR